MGTKHTLLAGALLAAALCLFAPAVGAEDAKTVGSLPDDGYTVTIPSAVAFAEGKTEQTLTISGTLGKYRTLDVTVASANDYALKYASDPTNNALPSLDYTLKCADTNQDFDSETKGKNTLSYTTDADENNAIKTTLNAEITSDLDTATMSGSYTDNLTFTFDCKKRTQECTINVYYETMDTIATGEITERKRNSEWTETPYVMKETLNLGEEHTFALTDLFKKGTTVDENAWESEMLDPETHTYVERTYSITPTLNETNYEIKVYRKLVWLDLNYIIYDSTSSKPLGTVDQGSEHEVATTWFTINNESGTTIHDHWKMHPYGSTYEMSNIKPGTNNPNYVVYGYWIRKDDKGVTENNLTTFDEDATNKTIGQQTLSTTFKSGSTAYGGDYSEAVYIIMRPYIVTIQYETMDSWKEVASPTDHDRHSEFDSKDNVVKKGIAFDDNNTYTWENDKYTKDSNSWKDEKYTVTKESGKYEYTIEVRRKMYALDLNVVVRTVDSSGSVTFKYLESGTTEIKEWGSAALDVNGKSYATSAYDYYTAHPYGSTFVFKNIKVSDEYQLLGYAMTRWQSDITDEMIEKLNSNDEIEKVLNDTTCVDRTIPGEKDEDKVDKCALVWLVLEKKTTAANDLLISDEETITPPTPSKTPVTDDTTTDDTLADDPAADTDDTPTPGDDDVTPDDTDDTIDTPSDADDTDDADTGTDDTELADDPADDPDVDDGDIEDTDAGDALDDKTDEVDTDAETDTEPLDILA